MELMSVLMFIDGEQVLLVLIYLPSVANSQEIRLFIEELTAQLEELHIDECNAIVLGVFNLDQAHDQYSYSLCFDPVFMLFYTYLWRNIRFCLPQ